MSARPRSPSGRASAGNSRLSGVAAAKPVVTLFILPRNRYCPSPSPACIKVETFLRLAKIPHTVVESSRPGPDGVWPWAEYKGRKISYSYRIIDALQEELDDPTRWEQSDPNTVIVNRLCDFSLYQHLLRISFVDNLWMVEEESAIPLPQPFFGLATRFLRKSVITKLNEHGNGSLTDREYKLCMEEDLRSLEHLLGRKAYFHGEVPGVADCAVFGHLHMMSGAPRMSSGDGNASWKPLSGPLLDFVKRMERLAYPDLDAILAPARARPKRPHSTGNELYLVLSVLLIIVGLIWAFFF